MSRWPEHCLPGCTSRRGHGGLCAVPIGGVPMTSAKTLRAAAAVLRERAAKATPGPWEHDPDMISGFVRTPLDADGDHWGIARSVTHEDGRWIETVHPGVGEPLAVWLEFEAGIADGAPEVYEDAMPAPVALARSILREPS